MKEQTSGALIAPQPTGLNVSESVNALSGQVSNLATDYRRALAPDCEVKTEADKWYFRAIGWACAGLLFPPLFVVTALCVYKAKKCRKGGAQ